MVLTLHSICSAEGLFQVCRCENYVTNERPSSEQSPVSVQGVGPEPGIQKRKIKSTFSKRRLFAGLR